MSLTTSLAALPTFDPEKGDLLSVIETPKGSRNKYAYNPAFGAFELKKVLPLGMLFPYDFGFFPSTKGDDGDPLDVLLLLDDPAPMGCIVRARVIGVIEAEQREEGKAWVRNDRLLAVAKHAKLHENAKSIKDLNPHVVEEIEAFFAQYNHLEQREFRTLKTGGPKAALKLIDEGQSKFSKPA